MEAQKLASLPADQAADIRAFDLHLRRHQWKYWAIGLSIWLAAAWWLQSSHHRMGLAEALVRTPLKELIDGLDQEVFWQIHRGTIVNANVVDRAVREGPEKLVLHLKGTAETLTVSRQYFPLFKQT